MSFELTHGFLAEAHVSERVVSETFAATFLRRVGVFRSGDLTVWFREPRARSSRSASPGYNG